LDARSTHSSTAPYSLICWGLRGWVLVNWDGICLAIVVLSLLGLIMEMDRDPHRDLRVEHFPCLSHRGSS